MRSSSFLNSRRNGIGSSRSNAKSRLGLPRPSLESMRTTTSRATTGAAQQPPHSEADTDYDSYDDEDEDAMEALLSRKHGEASEAGDPSSSSKSKRGASDQDIADEYAEQEKERKKKARRRVQHTVTPDDLLKPKGLTVVRHGIAPRFHSRDKDMYAPNARSMARYSRRLMSAYADWMDDLTGGLSLHETQWKLRSMGSKTQIKQYLADMRKSVRDDHVERLLGLEKAQRLLGQLEDYYLDEQQQMNEEEVVETYDHELKAMEDANANGPSVSSPTVANPYATSSDTTTARGPSAAVTPHTEKASHGTGDRTTEQPPKPQQEDPLQQRLRLQKEHRARRHVLEDSDDEEEEAIFEDVVPSSTGKVDANSEDDASPPPSSTTTKGSRRHVLEDDSDDDDDNNGDTDEELEIEKSEDAPNESTHKRNDLETPDKSVVTDREDPEDTSDDGDEGSTADFEVEANPSTISHVDTIEEKFQSVKALLEGGENTETATPRLSEGTAEPKELPLEGGIDAVDGSESTETSENDLEKQTDGSASPKGQDIVTGSSSEPDIDNVARKDGENQIDVAADK